MHAVQLDNNRLPRSEGEAMTSERKIASNRRNARLSTGPRTPAARKRATRNALRHGLAASAASDHIISAEVERLAIVLAGEKPQPARLELARIAAEAAVTLVRVRTARVDLVNQVAACTSASRATDIGQNIDRIGKRVRVANPQPPIAADGAPQNEAGAFLQILPQLVKLDRYEQRAPSRRKRAIRSLLTLG